MRPHETFREPSRKFFDRELVRSPICREIDLDSILGTCSVLDLATYCMVGCCRFNYSTSYFCFYLTTKKFLLVKIRLMAYGIYTVVQKTDLCYILTLLRQIWPDISNFLHRE